MAPTTSSGQTIDLPRTSIAPTFIDRHFRLLLCVITLAGLIPTVIVGRYQFFDFDAWLHLFVATQDRWLMLLGEWKYEAHPPIFYLVLRALSYLGHSHLVLRSVSILSGAGSVYVMGVIGSKLYRHKATALAMAFAFALSWDMIDLNIEVRAYSPSLLFVLLAFNAYVDWTSDPAGASSSRAIVRFGVHSLIALLTSYYVIYFLSCCAALLLLHAIQRPAFRDALVTSLRTEWKRWAFAIGTPFLVFVMAYKFHMLTSIEAQPYLADFIWREDSPLGLDGFLLTGFEREIAFFTPFKINPAVMLGIVCLAILPAFVYFALRRKHRAERLFATDVAWIVAIMAVELLVLSLARTYPFGGNFRHQSILAPFVFLTAFLLLDWIADALPAASIRNAVFAVASLLAIASFAYGWAVYPWRSEELMTRGYAKFKSLFPTVDTIYGDWTSLMFYYGETHNAKWTYQHRYLVLDHRITVYDVDDGSGHPVRILRNKLDNYVDLQNLETYQVLAETLRQEKLRSAVLIATGREVDQQGAKVLEASVHELAPQAGLQPGRLSLDQKEFFVEFTLR